MATARATTDHDEIRNWVEARGGQPSRVKDTGSRNDPGVLRIDFPGFSGEDTLEEIEWEEFFEWFDRNNLAVLLSEEAGNRFNKLVSRETAAESARPSRKRASSSKKTSSRRAARPSSAKRASSSKKASSSKRASSAKKASSAKRTSTTKKASAKKASSKKASAKRSSSTRKASRKKPSAKK